MALAHVAVSNLTFWSSFFKRINIITVSGREGVLPGLHFPFGTHTKIALPSNIFRL